MADTSKNSGLTKDLFDAMYTIVTGVVAEQKYDITKDCKIIEVLLDDNGERTGVYRVKSQDAVYTAYARQGEVYSAGQNVYVQIPNGDFNEQKFIVGTKVNADDEQDIYNLKMPFDDFIGFYNLTYNTPMPERGYWANCDFQGISEELVAEQPFPASEDHVWHWENPDVNGKPIVATKLGIEVDVSTLLHTFRPISGKYGLRIVLRGKYAENIETETTQEEVREYRFTSDNMYGNPYAYTVPSTQQMVIDTTGFQSYESIDIWFWQDHQFKDELGAEIPWGAKTEQELLALQQDYKNKIKAIADSDLSQTDKDIQINALMAEWNEQWSKSAELKNIVFNNLHVLLGLSVEEANKETITLYTYDVATYGASANNEEIKKPNRTLNAAWVHKVDGTLELIDSYERLNELNAEAFWYRYDPDWTTEAKEYNVENTSHKLGGNYWRPYDGLQPVSGAFSFEVTPNQDKAKERYKCIVFYDHKYVTSNIFIFQNINKNIETEKANIARNDRIILRCATIEDGALIPDDSLGNFFVYNENNNILKNDNNVAFSDIQYFIEPWIRVDNYIDSDYVINTNESTYVRLADYTDENGIKPNFTITWQLPESFTMIRSWGLLDESARDIEYWNHRSDALFELDKKATRYFYIDAIHNVRYNDNTISATIDIQGLGVINVKKELMFGRAGAFGCEFNPVIMISEPAGNYYVDTFSEFELRCLVYDRTGKLMPEEDRAQCQFSWRYIGESSKPRDDRAHLNYEGFQGNVIRGRVTQPIPFVVEVTVSKAAEYPITVRRGIMVSNNTLFMHKHEIIVPDRIEFRSDGQMPIFANNVFEVQTILGGQTGGVNTQNELIYPEWKINQTSVLRLVERKMEYPIFTLPDGQQVDKKGYTTYGLDFSLNALNNSELTQWSDKWAEDEYFTYVYFEHDGVTVAQAIAFARNLYPSSLVNEWDGKSLALDEENGAIMAKMIAAGTKDSHNRFTGVMMGDWQNKGDESLDTPGLYGFNAGQQSFGLKTDGTGFIGPAGEGRIQFDGRNALISNSTYTNYINLNPRRVENYLSQDANGGYVIDNQAWDSVGNQSFSQYFLYSKAPRRVTTMNADDGTNDAAIIGKYWDIDPDLNWVKPFFQDENHDYFVVDPNYGVATTGGIFARYGRLGKNHPWIISDYGLTQKNNFGRIFLGDPEKNLSIGIYIPTPTFTTFDGEVEAPDNFYSASFSNANNVIQTGIRADGYLYTRFATIGGWYINDNEIYAVNNTTFTDNEKKAAKGFRKTHIDDGYKNDLLNINSKNQFIAFNNGKFVINGKHGWMGFYSDAEGNTIDLSATPTVYNMLINFSTGDIGFGKMSNDIPYSYISGTDGSAYFSKGQIQIDGDSATIYCGVSSTDAGVFDAVDSITTGTLYLAGIQLQGITSTEQTSTDFVMPDILSAGEEQVQGSNDPTTDDYDSPGDGILPFNIGTYESITDDGQNATEAVGDLQYLTNFSGKYYLSTTIAGETYGIGGKGYFSILHPSNNDYGVKFYIGDNNLALVPTVSGGYLLGWNLESDYIIVNDTLAVTGVIDAGTIFMKDIDDNAEPIPALVATQVWVNRKIINEVWPKIKTVNNLASAAMKEAEKALKNAIRGINLANKALKQIEEGAIISIDLVDTVAGGYTGLDVKWTTMLGEAGEEGANIVVTNQKHTHSADLKASLGKITYTNGATLSDTVRDYEATIFTSTGFTLEASGGVVTGTVTVAGMTSTANFNIAATQYHMDQIAAAYKAGYSAGFAQCETDTQYTASSYTKESHSYTAASHSYKASSHSTNKDGTCSYTASSHSYTPAKHSYTASSYTASTFSPAQEAVPSSGWEAYY